MIVDIKFDEDNCSINPDFTESDCNVNINFEQVNVISSGKGAVKTVNGISPDENGNVTVSAMPNDLEQITILVDTDMLPAVHIGGAILTDNSGRIILRY